MKRTSRTEQEIFDDLAKLCASPGFIHALAWLCLRDNMIIYKETLKPKDLLHLYSDKRVIRTEVLTMLGLVARTEIDFSLPETATYNGYCVQAEALLSELHIAMTAPWLTEIEKLMALGPDAIAEAPKRFPMTGEGLREPIFYGADSAWSFQYRDFAPLKYVADKDWLLARKGFDLDQAKAVAHEILLIHNDVSIPAFKATKETNSYAPLLGAFEFTAEEVSARSGLSLEVVRAVIDAFCLPTDDRNSNFKSLSDFNAITARPILRHGEKFVLLEYYNLAAALYETPIYWMTDDPAYAAQAFRNRGTFAEELAYQRLASVFGPENVFLNVEIPGKKGETLGEIDVLVFFAGISIVVQAKTRRLSLAARKGNELKIHNDFKAAVQEAYDQAFDCAELLLVPTTKLLDCDKNPLVLSSSVTSVFPLCVVADHYPALALQAREFLKVRERTEVYAPLVVDVFALDAMAEMLESPLRLLSYLKLRARFGDKLNVSHEMTLLSDHIKRNLWVDDKYDMVHLHDDVSIDLEVAMLVRREGVPGKRTPDGILTRFTESAVNGLLKALENNPQPGMVDLGLLLLEADEPATADLSLILQKLVRETRKDGKLHDVTMFFEQASSGLTIHCQPYWTSEKALRFRTHCMAKKYQQRAATWYGIVIDPNGDVRIGLKLDDPWIEDKSFEAAISGVFQGKPLTPTQFHRQLRRDIKAGRNDPCPCKSGRKYKNCCLRN